MLTETKLDAWLRSNLEHLYKCCTLEIDSVEASIVVNCSEENLLSLLKRFFLRTYTTLKAILPVVQVGNVQRLV